MRSPPHPPSFWLSAPLWRGIGIGATVLWMVTILWITGSDPDHPRFKLIFIVPLIGWICGLYLGRHYQRRLNRQR